MAAGLRICIEDRIHLKGDPQFLACTALPYGEPGLGIDGEGRIVWKDDARAVIRLWAAPGGRLAMQVHPQGPFVDLIRWEALFKTRPGEAVVLENGDEFDVGERFYRVHIHGPAAEGSPPRAVTEREVEGIGQAGATAPPGEQAGEDPVPLKVIDSPPLPDDVEEWE